DDFSEADTILCVGQNPGTNHPRMLSALETAVQNGGTVVAVNPLKEAGLLGFAHPQKVTGMLNRATPLASQFLQVRPNGDWALFRGLAKEILEREKRAPGSCLDVSFLDEHTLGFEEYVKVCEAAEWSELIDGSGVSREAISTLVDTMLAGERKLITCWAMGLTQHHNAVATIHEVANLHFLLGAIGRPGAGLCPVRGHSNVQGDRTMGIFEKMPEWFLAALDREFHMESPRKIGYDTVAAILAMDRGEVDVFLALGGNFLQASPDTDFTARALEKCKLTCHISTKLNRSHLVTGTTALILPCLGRSERDDQREGAQFVTCENSMGVVHQSQGQLAPISKNLKSEPAIIAGIAQATLEERSSVPWTELIEDYDRIRELVERVIPGFESFNERVRQKGGFYLPNDAKERRWTTTSGKATFLSEPVDQFTVGEGRLVLQTLRSHDQFNTTVYGMNDRYRGIGLGRRIVFLNPEDMKERSISPVSLVDLTSYWQSEVRVAKEFYAIPYDMPRGAAAAYFPETNCLVPVLSKARKSHTPTSKAVEISVSPSQVDDA
ncbi:MAG: FdhF/YdeP family oxidoreductase, partial [Verrucomicrobiota bacterium]